MTRNWVLGMTVVTGKGDILRLNKGMIKNATGYALQHLFIGGEGTLGLVTEAEIKLERQPHDLQVLVLGVPDFDAIMPVLHAFQKKIDLTAFEFFGELACKKYWTMVMYNVRLKHHVRSMYYLSLKHHLNRSWMRQWKSLNIAWNKVGYWMA
jgi:FAD/FMN-containing dehydrogenases